MSLSLGVLYGLIAAVFWGVGDFLAKKAVDKFTALEFFYVFGGIRALIFGLPVLLYLGVPDLTLQTWMLLVVTIVLGSGGYIIYFAGFKNGNLSVVSPIAGSWALISVFIGIVFFGEKIGFVKSMAAIVVVLGLVLASIDWKELKKAKTRLGVGEAFTAMILWGVANALLKPLTEAIPNPLTLTALLMIVGILPVVIYLGVKGRLRVPMKKIKSAFLPSICEGIGSLAVIAGISVGLLSIVSPISSAFVVVTVLLAWMFLKEKLVRTQVFGIALILAGVAVLSI